VLRRGGRRLLHLRRAGFSRGQGDWPSCGVCCWQNGWLEHSALCGHGMERWVLVCWAYPFRNRGHSGSQFRRPASARFHALGDRGRKARAAWGSVQPAWPCGLFASHSSHACRAGLSLAFPFTASFPAKQCFHAMQNTRDTRRAIGTFNPHAARRIAARCRAHFRARISKGSAIPHIATRSPRAAWRGGCNPSNRARWAGFFARNGELAET